VEVDEELTVPRGAPRRACVPIPHSRPRQHLLQGTGQGGQRDGRAGVANAGQSAKGEFILRKLRRNLAPRIPRLPYSP
jgi:hypothetical protein